MSAAAPPIEKRKPLTRAQAIHLAIVQMGICGCGCGEALDPLGEGCIDEHQRALGLLGSNDLANRRLYRKPCASKKTGKGGDLTAIAKAKRQGGEAGQYARRKERGGSSIKARPDSWPPKGSRKLTGSRGFNPTRTA